MINSWAVTTSKAKPMLIEDAIEIARDLEIPYIERKKSAISKLFHEYNLTHLFVVQNQQVVLHHGDSKLFFHPGMALPRIKAMKQGQIDIMVKAMGITRGSSVLDCTIGLANDAIVMSAVVGTEGRVDGLESSPLIYTITKMGLERCIVNQENIINAMKRINVSNSNYSNALKELPDQSYDVLYFDPMFEKPLQRSSGIAGLRGIANYHQITEEEIQEALRVAKDRVVIKHRKNELNYLPFNEIISGNDSPIGFGIFYK